MKKCTIKKTKKKARGGLENVDNPSKTCGKVLVSGLFNELQR